MATPRTRSRRNVRLDGGVHPIGTPVAGVSPNTGPLASATWLISRELFPSEPRWFVEVHLDGEDAVHATDDENATRFQLDIYSEEWGYKFSHGGRGSWIRVTDIPFVHGRDDHGLLHLTPKLGEIGSLVRTLEKRHGIALSRDRALIRTNLAGAETKLRDWAMSL